MIGYLNSINTYIIIETHSSNCHARKQVGFWKPVTSSSFYSACSSSSMLTQSYSYSGKSWSASGSSL
jgi:hypothetical protein